MWKTSTLVVCLLLTGCDGSLTSGWDLDLSCDGCKCSNLETQQTIFVSNDDNWLVHNVCGEKIARVWNV